MIIFMDVIGVQCCPFSWAGIMAVSDGCVGLFLGLIFIPASFIAPFRPLSAIFIIFSHELTFNFAIEAGAWLTAPRFLPAVLVLVPAVLVLVPAVLVLVPAALVLFPLLPRLNPQPS
jgi:hypothetical protein